eukprot:FR740570.1.p1 GENE.FR740570.1~~FR740570.1.p1  ORF type:complete len:180 (+),score=14.42 FR740570.1:1-540(+)
MNQQLTNTGVVSALLLTIVLAALQADFPTDRAVTLLNQWYIIFICIGFCYGLSATAMSSICLMYMPPLEGPACEDFISIMALYFGEPIASMLICLWMCLLALVLWIWGQAGQEMGVFSTIIITYVTIRAASATQNLMAYKNPYVDEPTRKERSELQDRGNATPAALKVFETHGRRKQTL